MTFGDTPRRPARAIWRLVARSRFSGHYGPTRYVEAFCTPSQFCVDKHREFGFESEMTVLPNFLDEVTSEWLIGRLARLSTVKDSRRNGT